MWSLDPGIRDFMGPADYAWDFNAPDGVPGFALELGGDVKRLLAQAIGAPPEPEETEVAEIAAVEPEEKLPAGEAVEGNEEITPPVSPVRLSEAGEPEAIQMLPPAFSMPGQIVPQS